MPLLGPGSSQSAVKRDLASSNRVELSFMSRAEEYRMNAMAERPVGGLDAAMRNVMRNNAREEQPGCGNAACRSAWTFPWRSRSHPFFEERWACSGKCLLAMVEAAIAREVGDGRRDGIEVQHQHRIPLGLVMLAQGWITHPQLQKALEAQRAGSEGRIGDLLVSECGLAAEVVTRGLSVQWSCPVLTTEGFSPSAMALALPRVFVEKFGVLPLRVAGSKILYVAFEDRLDASSAFALEQMSGLRAESGIVVEEKFREARRRLLECKCCPVTECRVPDRDALVKAMATVIEHKQTVASRLVRLRQYYWLRAWTSGGRNQRGGNLPTNAADAHDYLFTLGKSA